MTHDPDLIERFAIRCALGNNGGTWATHYVESQKEFWRQFVRDLLTEAKSQPIMLKIVNGNFVRA